MSYETELLLAAGALAAAFIGLGTAVSRPIPNRFDTQAASALRGRGATLAILFTRSGRFWALVVLSSVAVCGFFVATSNPILPLLMIASQLLSQAVAEAFKRYFHRPRPATLLLHKKDIGFSYPSGHAITAVVFFAAWGLLALNSPLPNWLKLTLAAGLLIWATGILWSRLALSAHYVTDVLGGFLLGSAWLCAAVALADHLHHANGR